MKRKQIEEENGNLKKEGELGFSILINKLTLSINYYTLNRVLIFRKLYFSEKSIRKLIDILCDKTNETVAEFTEDDMESEIIAVLFAVSSIKIFFPNVQWYVRIYIRETKRLSPNVA